MKTAISIPDTIFQAAENLAQRLGVSRSELYVKAVSEYMERYRYNNVTETLNEIYTNEDSSINDGIYAIQLYSIHQEEW